MACPLLSLPGGFPPGLKDLYFERNYSLAEATMIQSQRPLEFEPGSKWTYCNAGIDTLGRIIDGFREGSKYAVPGAGLDSEATDLAGFYQMMLNGGTLDRRRHRRSRQHLALPVRHGRGPH